MNPNDKVSIYNIKQSDPWYDEPIQADEVFDLMCYSEIYKEIFGESMIRASMNNIMDRSFRDNKDGVMIDMFQRASMYLIRMTSNLDDNKVANIGIVNLIPSITGPTVRTLNVLKHFGLVEEARNKRIGSRVMQKLFKWHTDIVVGVEYAKEGQRDTTEFYRKMGFGYKYLIEREKKYWLMSTIKLLEDDTKRTKEFEDFVTRFEEL